jgi:hypothetical protein
LLHIFDIFNGAGRVGGASTNLLAERHCSAKNCHRCAKQSFICLRIKPALCQFVGWVPIREIDGKVDIFQYNLTKNIKTRKKIQYIDGQTQNFAFFTGYNLLQRLW